MAVAGAGARGARTEPCREVASLCALSYVVAIKCPIWLLSSLFGHREMARPDASLSFCDQRCAAGSGEQDRAARGGARGTAGGVGKGKRDGGRGREGGGAGGAW
eukprot:2883963-Rhodomonas_salina.1